MTVLSIPNSVLLSDMHYTYSNLSAADTDYIEIAPVNLLKDGDSNAKLHSVCFD